MQPFFHCAVAASLVSVGAVLFMDALVWLGVDMMGLRDVEDENNMMLGDSTTEEEEEAESHPELGEGDLLPLRGELPVRVLRRGRPRFRRRRWRKEDWEERGVKRFDGDGLVPVIFLWFSFGRNRSFLSEKSSSPPRKRLRFTRRSYEI